jgi:purine-binding chemotaxis protein CheW
MQADLRIASDQTTVLVVVFHAGAYCCGISVAAVECVIPAVAISSVPGAPRAVLGIINFHGLVVPVVDPRRRFNERGADLKLQQKILLVRTPARLVGLLADDIEGVEALAGHDIASIAEIVPGAGKLKASAARKGGLIYLYDVGLLLTRSEEKCLAAALRRRHE